MFLELMNLQKIFQNYLKHLMKIYSQQEKDKKEFVNKYRIEAPNFIPGDKV